MPIFFLSRECTVAGVMLLFLEAIVFYFTFLDTYSECKPFPSMDEADVVAFGSQCDNVLTYTSNQDLSSPLPAPALLT